MPQNNETALSFASVSLDRFLIFIFIHLLAILAIFNFSWNGVMGFCIAHFLTGCLGISIGYHRLLTHQSFKTHPWLRYILIFLGLLSFQLGPVTWSVIHHLHHRFADTEKDPHSKQLGFAWSHFGWFLNHQTQSLISERTVLKMFNKDKLLQFMNNYYLLINLLVASVAFVCMPFSVWLWTFPLRIAVVWHSTWLINSICHSWNGFIYAPTNNFWVSLLTYGEGLHANHHAQPHLWNFSLNASELDLSGLIVSFLRKKI